MGFTAQDRAFMPRALELAAGGRGRVEPNPMVGAVVVRDGCVLGEGCHERLGGPHAEVAALRAVEAAGRSARGATLYCTLEPCAHQGKTPPCAPAVARAGIRRVVAAAPDPMWAVHHKDGSPRGMEVLERAGVQVEAGLLADEAVVLNAAFFKRAATGAPLVIAKWAMSADGKIATHTGSSRWITSAASRALVHEVRGCVDAVIAGSHTVRRDDPLLTCRDAELRRVASRVVLCGADAPPAGSRLVRSARQAPVLLAHVAGGGPAGLAELQSLGCDLLPLAPSPGSPGLIAPAALLRALGDRGASNVLVEGGAEVLGCFFDAGLVDRVMVFVAPLLIGGAQAVTAVGGRGMERVEQALRLAGPVCIEAPGQPPGPAVHTRVRLSDCDLLIEGWVRDPLQWKP